MQKGCIKLKMNIRKKVKQVRLFKVHLAQIVIVKIAQHENRIQKCRNQGL